MSEKRFIKVEVGYSCTLIYPVDTPNLGEKIIDLVQYQDPDDTRRVQLSLLVESGMPEIFKIEGNVDQLKEIGEGDE